MWIWKQPPTCSRGTRCSYRMKTLLSVQNTNFSGRRKGVYESFSSRRKVKSHWHWIWQNLENPVQAYHGIIVHQHSIWSDTNGIAERAVRRIKEKNSAALFQSGVGWKMVGWFYRMLMLFAKCPRIIGSWEHTLWKAIWRTIQRPSCSVWCEGQYHLISAKDQSRLINLVRQF